MEKVDYKKKYPDLYLPKTKPMIIEIPEMSYVMVEGKGDPNQTEGEYKKAMEILYGLSFTIKMSKMKNKQLDGYFDYVVPPLEGLWWTEGKAFDGIQVKDKGEFLWTSMIRQPEFVTKDVFEWAKQELKKKKPDINFSKTTLTTLKEGLCIQIMHVGPYDEEPNTISQMQQFLLQSEYEEDIGKIRKHHEIYLGDPRRTKPENLRTVIRHPIKKKEG